MQEVQKRLGTTPLVYDTLSSAIASASDQFDAVDLMVPHDLHESLSLLAFEAKKHVLLEKPIAITIESAERMIAAAQKVQVVFNVAEMMEYATFCIGLKNILTSKQYGETLSFGVKFWQKTYGEGFDPGNWRSDMKRAGGGFLFDAGAHFIRPLRVWFGEIAEVVAVTGVSVPTMQGESMAHALLRFKSGYVASFGIILSTTPFAPLPIFQIKTTKGELTVDGGRNSFGRPVRIYDEENPKGCLLVPGDARECMFAREIDDFIGMILEVQQTNRLQSIMDRVHSALDGLNDLKVLLALLRSTKTNQWEKV